MSHRFYMPTEVRCGVGALDGLDSVGRLGRQPVILCGRHAARRYGHLDGVLARLPGARVVDGFPENPTFTDCEARVEACRDADFIVALGGGSVLDGAKALALLSTNGGQCRDYLDREPGVAPLPLVAIPTTAGTGSEVTPYAVLVDPVRHRKSTLKSPTLFPRLALLDPALTRSLPREITLATGLDALSQAMEGMVSRNSTPAGDLLAVGVCQSIFQWLPAALDDPDNGEAREQLLHAAMLSGVVIAQSGTTLVHGMGYYLTLEHGIAHGIANALLLPPLFLWNGLHQPEKTALLASALGVSCAARPTEAAQAIAQALYGFYDKLHFNYAGKDHGVPESSLQRMTDALFEEPYRFKNQVGDLTTIQVHGMFHGAWSGSVKALGGALIT